MLGSGGGGVPVPSVPGTWRQIDVVVPSAGGTLGRLVNSRGIKYDTEYSAIVVPCGGKSGWMQISSGPGCPLS